MTTHGSKLEGGPESPDEPMIGRTIGSIRIESRLGRGGMGEVYLGFDPRLERRVAIKTIRPEQRLSPVQKARLLREARLLGRLGHPSICQVHDLIETPDADYLVLEYIEGATLAALARRESLPLDRKLELAEKIAGALVVAHREQVVHRDLKADNVMVTPAGEVKVLDFGIARPAAEPAFRLAAPPPLPAPDPLGSAPESEEETWVGGTPGRETGGEPPHFEVEGEGLTRHGVIVGSLQAMSPEQASGGEVTTASDLYSFGVLLQELLTGEGAYAARDPLDRLAQVRRAEIRPLPREEEHDPDLLRLLRDLQSFDPRRRPSAEGAVEQIRALRAKPQRLRRKRLRRRAAAAAFALLFLGLAAVSWFAWQAERSRREAEKRRRQAEGLIGFMLGDLRDRLEKVNRLDLLDAVGDRALAYFGELPEGELTRSELVGRVRALLQIGEVRYSQGGLGAALVAFRRAEALASDLARRDVGNREAARALQQAEAWLGQALYDQGSLEEALAVWRKSEALAGRLAEDPGDLAAASELAAARHNVGTVLELRGDLDGALREYRGSLALQRRLAERSPADLDIQAAVAATLAFVSNTLERKGELAAALVERRAHLALVAELARREPDDPARRSDLAVAQGFVASLLAVMGEGREARERYGLGLAAFEALAAGDPDNALHQRWLGAFHSAFGELLRMEGEAQAALAALARARSIFEGLLRKDPENPDFRLQLATSRQRAAAALAARGEIAAGARGRALAEARAAEEILAPLAGGTPEEPARGALASAAVTLGRIEAAAGNADRARAASERALALLAPCRRPLTYWKVLAPWAEAQIALGRPEEARPALAELERMGFSRRELAALAAALAEEKAEATPPR